MRRAFARWFAAGIEQTLEQTTSTFGRALQSRLGPAVRWDELDLRAVSGKAEQIERIKAWGRLRSVRVEAGCS